LSRTGLDGDPGHQDFGKVVSEMADNDEMECSPEHPKMEGPVAPELVHVAELAARIAARDAVRDWVAHSANMPAMSRAELSDIIRSTCNDLIDERLHAIGLDMKDPAETATKLKLLFRTQHAAGMVVVWTTVGIIGAAVGGMLWLLAAPWRIMHGGNGGSP